MIDENKTGRRGFLGAVIGTAGAIAGWTALQPKKAPAKRWEAVMDDRLRPEHSAMIGFFGCRKFATAATCLSQAIIV